MKLTVKDYYRLKEAVEYALDDYNRRFKEGYLTDWARSNDGLSRDAAQIRLCSAEESCVDKAMGWKEALQNVGKMMVDNGMESIVNIDLDVKNLDVFEAWRHEREYCD